MADLTSQRNHRQVHGNKRRHAPKTVKSRVKRFILRALLGGIFLAVLGGGIGWVLFVKLVQEPYGKWAEEFDLERINDLEKPSIIYDRNGLEIGRIYVENRSYVPLSQISENMINALIAQEDARFREHSGFDPLGILRAGKELVEAKGKANQGASSITQQLARNAYDLKQRAKDRGEGSYGRKLVEIFLAMRITERYSKDQVLEFYLNRVYLGEGYYGIRAASLGYFGKEPLDLTTRESASIAALIKYPNGLSPVKDIEENKKWRNHVLARMAKEGYITSAEADRLSAMPVELNRKPLKRSSSHINNRIARDIIKYLGEDRVNASGLKIYTTLDKQLQDATEEALTKQLDSIEKKPGYSHMTLDEYRPGTEMKPNYLDGAVLVIDNETGAVLAYHGGRSFVKRNYDNIEEGARPPGTAILPFLYATAFEAGYSPAYRLLDDAIDNRRIGIGGTVGILGEWGVETIKNRYHGEITARQALSQSKIAASLRLGIEITPKPFIDKISKFGIRKPVRESGTEVDPLYRPRIYIGTEPASLKEMTLAYTAIASQGLRPNDIYYLDRVEDESGYPIWESPQALGNRKKVQATNAATAFQIHTILQDSLKSGSAQRVSAMLPPNFQGGVKTGTNYNFADNMLFAYDSRVTCGVWVGFTDGSNAIYPYAFSSDTCGPIAASAISASLKSYPETPIAQPPTIESVEICLTSGKRATRNCYERDPKSTEASPRYIRNTYTEFIRKGDMSLPVCDVHVEEGMDLGVFFTPGSKGPSRILPVIPILPIKPALIGDDPYHTEQVVSMPTRNLEFVPGGDEAVLEAQPVEDDEGKDTGLTIPLPYPKPVQFNLPEIKTL